MKRKIVTISLLTIFAVTTAIAQNTSKKTIEKPLLAVAEQTEVYKEIVKVDSAMFYAFNNCDSVDYKKYLADDLEFYHDLGGLHFLAEEMQSVKEMCARNSHIRRELIKGTLEVHQLGDFGAVEIGIHRIYHTNKGETEHISGDYKFIHVWQKKDGVWKLKRVISYGHDKINNN
jgi:ketosteroid isomerase-like protein